MSAEQIAGLVIALLLMGIGILGSVLPGIPSTPLVLLAAIGHRIYFGEHSTGPIVLGLLVIFTVLSLIMDYLTSVYGAKKLGATWRGAFGAVLGGLIGLFFSLPGVIIGPFIGALVFELIGGRNFKESSRAGLGATIGLLVGTIGKIACCVAMMGLFAINVIWRSV
jgi:uncharacterized protein